jgi:NAD(P)-dependent dehydrogenase (short-subunit alcohol dehydrogenase family)
MGLVPDELHLNNFRQIFALDGRVAVITGGSRGLGLAVAAAFVSLEFDTYMNVKADDMTSSLLQVGCYKVFIVSRKADACRLAAEALNKSSQERGLSGIAIPLPADLSKMSKINRLVDELGKQTPYVDILFANAGATWGAPFEDQPEDAFTKILNLNVKSIFYTVQKMLPLLQARGKIGSPSRVIVNSSAAGIAVGTLGKNGTHAYSISKAAAIHLAKVLAVELGPRGVSTNAICPGFFPTKMSAGLIGLEGGVESITSTIPNRRFGTPDDIGSLVVFLSSRAAAHINGAVIAIDGGAHLQPAGAKL